MTAPDPGGGFRVDPDDIGVRASALDALAEGLRMAAEGAFPVDPWSYGVIGALFGGLARTAAADAKAAISELSTVTADAARSTRATQAAYLDIDAIMSARFRELGR